MPDTALSYLTVPRLAAELHAPVWLVRKIVDRLGGAPRVGWMVRLIDPALAERVRVELARRKEARHA